MAREREVEGDLFLWDMGDGLSFRPGTFDGVISISALQWLCNADKSYHRPHKRLLKFFTSLYASMVSSDYSILLYYCKVRISSSCIRKHISDGIVHMQCHVHPFMVHGNTCSNAVYYCPS